MEQGRNFCWLFGLGKASFDSTEIQLVDLLVILAANTFVGLLFRSIVFEIVALMLPIQHLVDSKLVVTSHIRIHDTLVVFPVLKIFFRLIIEINFKKINKNLLAYWQLQNAEIVHACLFFFVVLFSISRYQLVYRQPISFYFVLSFWLLCNKCFLCYPFLLEKKRGQQIEYFDWLEVWERLFSLGLERIII